jgi:hypothetical protein
MGMFRAILFLFSLFSLAACSTTRPIKPFVSDGCTCSPDGNLSNPKAWEKCCVQHDSLYWQGGSRVDRKVADSLLCDCISKTGNPKKAKAYYRVVRTVGGAWIPVYWRWGFGYRYGSGYRN